MSVEVVGTAFCKELLALADPSPLQELSRNVQARSRLKKRVDERRFKSFCDFCIDLYIQQALSDYISVCLYIYIHTLDISLKVSLLFHTRPIYPIVQGGDMNYFTL
jgi:hypothetical protein